jgi:hypothetical protein
MFLYPKAGIAGDSVRTLGCIASESWQNNRRLEAGSLARLAISKDKPATHVVRPGDG